ncbi:MAG: NUDIX domain-containing protein, partial [Sphingomonadaceae bacterium]
MKDTTLLPYRPAAAIMLLNRENKVWVGQRLDTTLEAWQMPQGGLDQGEEPRDGALRELHEETGITPDLVEIIAQSKNELLYDLPEDLIGKLWKGRY